MSRYARLMWPITLGVAGAFYMAWGPFSPDFFHNFDPASHLTFLFVENLLLMMAMLTVAQEVFRETASRWKVGILAVFMAGAFFSECMHIIKQLW